MSASAVLSLIAASRARPVALSLKMAVAAAEGKRKATNMRHTSKELVSKVAGIRAIALDGGTTNTRARLIEGGRIVATARREVGVRDTALSAESPLAAEERASRGGGVSSKAQRLADAVRSTIEEVAGKAAENPPELIVAAGMLSSELGLVSVPHVFAPAGIPDLAAAMAVRTIPEITPIPIGFVPGVRTPASSGPLGWTHADVMRGEECETFGALMDLETSENLDLSEGGLVFVWPGSHTKVVGLDRHGRIDTSHTSLAGELLQAVARNTLITASLPSDWPDVLDPQAVLAGSRAVLEQGLNRAAFLVRLATIEGALGAPERTAFWMSAVVTDDSHALARHPILKRARWVGVGGREPLRGLYVQALRERISVAVERLADETCERASALGALAVALSRAECPERGPVNPR